jgi:hypothetical protein
VSQPESGRVALAYLPMDLMAAFGVGCFLAMVVVSGWPPDIGEERTWIAGGVGGLLVVVGLFVSRRRWRAKSPGA